MENNKMRTFLVLCFLVVSGCSVAKSGVGQVAHQVITCTSSEGCKEALAKDCPKGGVIYGVRQALEIEYSCNSN